MWRRYFITTSKWLFVLCSFSSTIFNVLEYEPNSLTSALYVAIVYPSLVFFLTWVIFSDADEGRKVIFYKISDCGKNHSATENIKKSSSDTTLRGTCKEALGGKIDLPQLLLRISRIAYFSHAIIIVGFYSRARESIDPLNPKQVRWLY